MTLQKFLSSIVGEAFVQEGFDRGLGVVRASDRADLAQFQCNGALAAGKATGSNPRALADAVCSRLSANPVFSRVDTAGPGFINLFLNDQFIADRLEMLKADRYEGAEQASPCEMVIVDYGGPNVAKPLHVGHLRAAIIGESLKRILRFVGHRVIGDVHLGDWGLQMGQLISELEARQPDLVYFDEAFVGPYPAVSPISLDDLEEMYPAASAACKADADRADLARKATKALQDGRPGYRALWRHFVTLSVAAMKSNYDDLGVEFDLWNGESDAAPLVDEIASDLRARALLVASEGAEIIPVARADDKKEMPPVIFLNSEGAVGYHATDIATIVDRKRKYAPDRILYVVDARQRLHFEQVFRVAEKAGYFPEDRLEHLWFGTMNGKDGKPFKTREGGVLKLRDMIDLVEAKARERLVEGGFGAEIPPEERHQIARLIGVAALKFADLSSPRTSDYIFDLDRFMTFEGKTGPYLLYASVRIRALLRKAEEAGRLEPGPVQITVPEERDLGLVLLAFGEAIITAVEKRMPHPLCDHAFALAQNFSRFYAACRINDEPDAALRASRLSIATLVGRQLDQTLTLLGIRAPEKM